MCRRNGSLVYVPGEVSGGLQRSLVWVDREGREEQVAVEPQPYFSVRLSPDGQRVVTQAGLSDNSDLEVYDLARDTPLRFTFDPAADAYPIWTPDGQRILWSSTRFGPVANIVWRAADGTGQVERLTTSENNQVPYSWSADGQTLVMIEQRPETGVDIGMLSMDGEDTIKWLLEGDSNESSPDISPDGRWMAYVTDESGQSEVFVTPFPSLDGRWPISRSGGFAPQWGPDSSELFFQTFDGTIMVVTNETEPTFSPGIPVPVVDGPYAIGEPPLPRSFDISLDGQRLLMIKEATGATVEGPEIHVVLNWTEELTRLVPTN